MSRRLLPEPDPCNCPSLPGPTAELELVSNLVIPTADAGFVELTGDNLPKDPPPYVLVIESANGLPKLMSLKKVWHACRRRIVMKTLKCASRTVWLILSVTFGLILSGCSGQMTVTEFEANGSSRAPESTAYPSASRSAMCSSCTISIRSRTGNTDWPRAFAEPGTRVAKAPTLPWPIPIGCLFSSSHGDALADTKPSFGLNIDGTLKEAKIENVPAIIVWKQ